MTQPTAEILAARMRAAQRLLDSKTAKPAAQKKPAAKTKQPRSFTRFEIARMSQSDYRKNRSEIFEAARAGLIK